VHNPRDQQFTHITWLKVWVGKETVTETIQQANNSTTANITEGSPLNKEQKEIDKILNNRVTASGIKYLIQFRGHTDRYNQWVPIDKVSTPLLIRQYEHAQRLGTATSAAAKGPPV